MWLPKRPAPMSTLLGRRGEQSTPSCAALKHLTSSSVGQGDNFGTKGPRLPFKTPS